MQIKGSIFKELRKKTGMTQKQFAEALDITERTVQNYEAGATEIRTEILQKIRKEYGIDLLDENTNLAIDSITGHKKPVKHSPAANPDIVYLEILSAKAAAGYGVENYEVVVTGQLPVLSSIIRPYREEAVKVITITGDSMNPTIYNGDYVLYVPNEISGNGIYIIEVFGDLLCKRLEFKLTGDIVVISDNPLYEKEVFSRDNETLRICGKVIGWIHQHHH